jgi:hypothetical protein
MATSVKNGLTVPNRPMRLSQPVPDEVWASILSHSISERETLRAVIRAKRAASTEALRLYWKMDLSRPGLLEELLQQREDQQQLLANMVRHIVVGSFVSHLFWTPSTLGCPWLSV